MSDLISRQAAIDAVGKYLKKDDDVITIADVVDAAVAIVMLPSAQPEPIKINIDDFNKEDLERFKKELGNTPITVLPAQPEIIRCKDCKYFERRSIYHHGLCDVHCNGVGEKEVTSEGQYCSWAERKEE